MRIVILGAGTVGTWVADLLCQQAHSVTIIDIDPRCTRQVNEELDVRTITGSGSQSSILFQAGVIGADMFLSLSGVDEVNFVAASMAKAMGVRRSVARVYAPVFRDLSTFDYQRHFNIDRLLSLEHLSAMELARGIRNPGSLVMSSLARGELEALEVEVGEGAAHLDTPLKDLNLPSGVRIASIQRQGQLWIAGANDVIQPGDRIMLVGDHEEAQKIRELFRRKGDPYRTIVIAGGGETGYHLSRALERGPYRVTLMEWSERRCDYLSKSLRKTTVLKVDATRRAVMEEERVGSADFFIAATGDDENNIMAGVEARDIGASKVMAVVGRPDYAAVVAKLGIDMAVSPRDVMARQVMGMLNTGAVVSRTSLPSSTIGVYEIDVLAGAAATGKTLAELDLPPKCLIAAVMRETYVHVPGAKDKLQPGDTIIALIDDQVAKPALKLFDANGS